jgi:hypothetical protein
MKYPLPVVSFGILTALFLAHGSTLGGRPSIAPPAVLAQEVGWKGEFEAVCAKTDIAMTLSAEELKELVAGCDRLKPKIEAEEESTRKVYLRRLQMCRDLYKYILDTKESR